MSENVWEQLGNKSETLQAKLEQNADVANTVMALLGNLIVLANDKGVPFEGITFDTLSEDSGEFKSRVTFSPLNVGNVNEVAVRADFLEYARSRSHNMARALERSPRLQRFFETLVEALERYSVSNGIGFEALKVHKRFITPDNVLVFKVGRDVG